MGRLEDANGEIVRSIYEASFRGDLGPMFAALDDEIELESLGPTTVPFAGLYKGRQAIDKFLAIIGESFDRDSDDPLPVIQEIISQGNRVVVIGNDFVRSRATGLYYDGWWVHIIEMSEGRIIRIRQFYDTASACAMFHGLPAEPEHVFRQ